MICGLDGAGVLLGGALGSDGALQSVVKNCLMVCWPLMMAVAAPFFFLMAPTWIFRVLLLRCGGSSWQGWAVLVVLTLVTTGIPVAGRGPG